ncbi:MAG: DUF2088 domain-containing protein, partial [Cyanobacteria bacterium HKST-UBA02]|nr:DUF2088 domain-containing protein [Cyanobacteria bacterium HKST-UBA02]
MQRGVIPGDIIRLAGGSGSLGEDEVIRVVRDCIDGLDKPPARVLLVPPDITRLHSGAGPIACAFYQALNQTAEVKVLPALGTHTPMTEKEMAEMYPSIPFDCFIHHDWRNGVESVGAIPADLMAEVSGGYIREELPVKISRHLLEPWDLIVSIGQVVPHEVAGLANYTKNIVIGCGGKEVIDRSHMVSALFGIEKTLGESDTPVRTLLDYAQENFLAGLPLLYVLTVTGSGDGSRDGLAGIFAGSSRSV